MAHPARQLQALYAAGFDLQTFDRYPKAVGVAKGNCIVLMTAATDGLIMLGAPGWRMGEVLGVLTEVSGRKVFQAKAELLEATAERVEELHNFTAEVRSILRSEEG
jgi:hypothetical protein